eukprot:CAMPEP_0196594952 /NCGR_PEP_ID=MMETSP1081-20130531/79762_1 /TAXON_ID=36882 /ORGANISM="Pyramimonas amylifera, Strain CCMP720" /LENGTH=131 /DNA_ID=CAMNT_0041919371 /DNA_START=130 /DNA_END=525 /DNA_ORIENTATION=+
MTCIPTRKRTASPMSNNPVTKFQYRVYQLCKAIPKGRVSTYGRLAKKLGSSPRAVGQALKKNPFAPIVPCHRVVAASLALGGFFGQWGTETPNGRRKQALLESEGVELKNGYVNSSFLFVNEHTHSQAQSI